MISTMLRCGVATESAQAALRLFEPLGYAAAIEAALDETGRREKRACPLRASLMVTLVVALSLYRDLSIPDVFRQLLRWLRRRSEGSGLRNVTDEALLAAKKRLGSDVMPALFRRTAESSPVEPSFHGLRVYGVDGVKFDVPDSEANAEYFGRCKSSNGARAAFPQMSAVVLLASETRQVKDVRFGECHAPEREACEEMLSEVGSDALILIDRGFQALWLYDAIRRKEAHLLCRITSSQKYTLVKRLGRGDYLVEVAGRIAVPQGGSPSARRSGPKRRLLLRLVEYRVGRHKRVRLLTSLLDPKIYPAREVALLYHKRWENELAYDEIKTHLASPSAGTLGLTFRSESPELVMQEAYGLLIAYNLVRSLIAQAATSRGVSPLNISFVGAINAIDRSLPELEAATVDQLPDLLQDLLADIAAQRNRRPRRPRRYPRVVKVKIARFPRKRSWHRQHRVDEADRLRLLDRRSERALAA